MNKCDKYHTYDKWVYSHSPLTGTPVRKEVNVGICWGTKDQEECNCGGDTCKCDFYPHVRASSNKDAELTLVDIKQKLESAVEHVLHIDTSGYVSDENHKTEALIILMNIIKDIDKHND